MKRLFYLEDHEIFARGVIDTFLHGFEVEWVDSLGSARRAWSIHKPCDAVLADYDLPDGKGASFVRWVRASGFTGPILAVSAHDDGNRLLLEAGASGCCCKTEIFDVRERLDALWG